VLGRRVLPPDPTGEAGPHHYVQAVNVSFGVFDKHTGAPAPGFPKALSDLWAGFGTPCESAGRGDPIVLYDQLADRWNISQFAFDSFPEGPFFQCIAISTTGNPTGSYHRYAFLYDEEEVNDYPKLAVWPDAYTMTVDEASGPNFTFSGVGVVAFDRAAMLEGRPATSVQFELPPDSFGLLPADLDGSTLPPPGSPNYLVSVAGSEFGETDAVEVWQLQVDFAVPAGSTLTGPVTLPVESFDGDLCGFAVSCIPQPATDVGLQAFSETVMMRAAYRNFGTHESIVFNHSIDVDGTDHAGVRFYEIRQPGNDPVVFQQGTHAPDADHRWMASVAMDAAGNLALGYSVSGPATFPSARYAGRLASDPPGTLPRGEASLVEGGGSQTSFRSRWGDYSHLVTDPTDDCTFWYTSEYYATTSQDGWRTRIGSFAFPGCDPPPLTCAGLAPTIAGTGAAETLVGTPGDDVIAAGGADDIVIGGGGNDVICGGEGNDTLDGRAGMDRLFGEVGDDRLLGASGNDMLDGGQGADQLIGDAGADELIGGEGRDSLRGGAGDDRSFGGADHDRLTDGDGDDLLEGEAGDDDLRGGAGDDDLRGGAGDDRLLGEAGNDGLDGGEGDDRLNGGVGTDACNDRTGADVVGQCEGELT
jgi:hypothetical protein